MISLVSLQVHIHTALDLASGSVWFVIFVEMHFTITMSGDLMKMFTSICRWFG